MRLRRETAHAIHLFLDEWLPPVLRDSRWFMWPLFKLFYGPFAQDFLNFKEKAETMTEKDFEIFYTKIANAPPQRETHLTQASLKVIIEQIKNSDSLIDVGAGKGYLVQQIAHALPYVKITACDIHLDLEHIRGTNIQRVQSPIETLPFENQSFDTVICTHTLEHIIDIQTAIRELRRICKKKLIIVVPRQRPYCYTFDPHVWFFPYRINLRAAFGTPIGKIECQEIQGDWLYIETRKEM